jgi:hypothetical protein
MCTVCHKFKNIEKSVGKPEKQLLLMGVSLHGLVVIVGFNGGGASMSVFNVLHLSW